MHIANITTKHHARITVTLFAMLLAVLATACDDFYTDSPPTPDIAQPTPANVIEGDPEVLLETVARDAIAASLGIDASAPKKILFEDDTWTERNPGCYPTPSSLTGAYLIPGYRMIMQHDGVFYEYNADQGATTGALCESTFQTVPVEPAHSIVTAHVSDSPYLDVVHVIRSEEDVAEFNSTNSDMASIEVDVIDFPEEVLVGSWIEANKNVEPVRAYRSTENSSIIIELAIPDDLDEEEDIDTVETTQIWAFLDATEPNSTYEFVVVE
jgi:hypothetical protein